MGYLRRLQPSPVSDGCSPPDGKATGAHRAIDGKGAIVPAQSSHVRTPGCHEQREFIGCTVIRGFPRLTVVRPSGIARDHLEHRLS